MKTSLLSRAQVEDFLYREAQLLDEWKLDEWLALFEEGATYEVPTAGAADEVSSSSNLFYIADDYHRLKHRVLRLTKSSAHAEWPHSLGARAITNVRITEEDVEAKRVKVRCVFTTYRTKNNITHTFFGHHIYVLKVTDEGIRIASKRTILDMNSLRDQGRVSIIV